MAHGLYNTIRTLRERNGFSQQQMADMLDINRVSYVLSEKGQRKFKPEELEKMSTIFDLSIEKLLYGIKMPKTDQNTDFDQDKFTQTFLYILEKCGILPNVGKTVLYKLLYFSDFDYYELTGKSITGANYIRLPMGPAPCNFDIIMTELVKDNKIMVIDQEYGNGYYQKKYIPNELYDGKTLSLPEKKVIDESIRLYSRMTAKEISEFSHGDYPRQATKDMDVIPYSLALQRAYPYSPIARNKKREESTAMISNNPAFSFLVDEPDLYDDL